MSINRQFYHLAHVALLLLVTLPAHAKRYLTPMQAQKLCFPEADTFEWKTHRYSAAEAGRIKQLSGTAVQDPGAWYALALKDGRVIGAIVVDRVTGKHELIDYVVALDPTGKVRSVEILEYRESIGDEVRRAGWRKQFHGKDSRAKIKLYNDIANISGATISCRNITDGVRRICSTWQLVLRPALESANRLPKLGAR